MATVTDLVPGQVIVSTGHRATFIGVLPHPLRTGFVMVIWRLWDGTTSLDALSPRQEVGAVDPNWPDLTFNLHQALEYVNG